MGLITSRHGGIYCNAPFGWDQSFEALIGRITADFIDSYKPEKERCWIAEKDDAFIGCIMLVEDKENPEVAKLRLLLVEEAARGMGVASKLIKECIDFASSAQYKTITLWTQSILEGARRLYKQAGFRLVDSQPHESFGQQLVGETWNLDL